MKSQVHPLRHFETMTTVARDLATLPAQILEHAYNYAAFGSWWTTVQRKGIVFRVVFDGKDHQLRLEQAGTGDASEWKVLSSWPVDSDGGVAAIPEVVARLRAV
jgi:hypothetical protein